MPRRILVITLLVSCLSLHHLKAASPEGDWTLRPGNEPDSVRLALFKTSKPGSTWRHESQTPLSTLEGLTYPRQGRQEVEFQLQRDAGKILFEGYLKNGKGAGSFKFEPRAEYAREMRSLGFSINGHSHFDLALHDVSLEFAEAMHSAELSDLDTDQLVAFRIHGVTLDFVEELRTAGQDVRSSKKLVAFRIHGVSPEMVRSLHDLGYTPEDGTLIALRIHGATPEWIREIGALGYDQVDLKKFIAFRIHGVSPQFISELKELGYELPKAEKLIAFRIHGVSPEFVGELEELGYEQPQAEKLISMRIHNVTPGFIKDLQSRGMQPSVDQLIKMRIHGIE